MSTWKTLARKSNSLPSGWSTAEEIAADLDCEPNEVPKILAAAPSSEKARIEANYRKVGTTPQGTYALIDYVNFKGDGTVPTEKYKGQGWGLLQVLGAMKDVPVGASAAAEFAASAKRMLSRRITNSPPERGEKRWEEGWHNRCATYSRPL